MSTDGPADLIAASHTAPSVAEDVAPRESPPAEGAGPASAELFLIPNFRADQETLTEYDQTITVLVQRVLQAAIDAVREGHEKRRKELEAEVGALQQAVMEANAASGRAVARYLKVARRKKRSLGLTKPTFFEQLRSFFRAGGAYRQALAAEKTAAAAYARLREGEANVDKHNRRLEGMITSRELELRRFYNSEEGKAALVRQPYLRSIFDRVETIKAERAAYQERFEAGKVSPEEQRAREMARDGYAFLDGAVSGVFFLGQVTYQIYQYHILRDRDGYEWLVDFDPRLQPLERMLLDVRPMADGGYTIRRSTGPDPRVVGTTPPLRDTRRKVREVDPRLHAALVEFAQNPN